MIEIDDETIKRLKQFSNDLENALTTAGFSCGDLIHVWLGHMKSQGLSDDQLIVAFDDALKAMPPEDERMKLIERILEKEEVIN